MEEPPGQREQQVQKFWDECALDILEERIPNRPVLLDKWGKWSVTSLRYRVEDGMGKGHCKSLGLLSKESIIREMIKEQKLIKQSKYM